MLNKISLASDWPGIDPGSFRHRVTLLQPTITAGLSGSVATFAASDPPIGAWAKIDYVRGTDLIKAGVEVSQTFTKVTSWWRPEFTVQCQIQFPSGSVYRIQNVENVREMNTYMVLTCLAIGVTQ
jgi:head-tail adaptor